MTCGFECHQIGGPYITENPDCPIHGTSAQERQQRQYGDREVIRDILCDVVNRGITVNVALDEIFGVIGDLYEC